MSESDRLKADISFHEKMFFAAIAILVTLVGLMASHYPKVNSVTLVRALFVSIGAGIFVIFQYRLIKELIKELTNV